METTRKHTSRRVLAQTLSAMNLNQELLISITQGLIAFICAVFWLGTILPSYGLPFGGCDRAVFAPGCSDWPDVVRGFGFLLILLVIGPRKSVYLIVSLIMFAIICLTDGLLLLKTGELFSIKSIEEFIWLIQRGLDYFVGGIVALGMYIAVIHLWKFYRENEST